MSIPESERLSIILIEHQGQKREAIILDPKVLKPETLGEIVQRQIDAAESEERDILISKALGGMLIPHSILRVQKNIPNPKIHKTFIDSVVAEMEKGDKVLISRKEPISREKE